MIGCLFLFVVWKQMFLFLISLNWMFSLLKMDSYIGTWNCQTNRIQREIVPTVSFDNTCIALCQHYSTSQGQITAFHSPLSSNTTQYSTKYADCVWRATFFRQADISIQNLTRGFPLFVRSSFVLRSYVTLRGPPLDSETGWTGELWSNCVLLILEN